MARKKILPKVTLKKRLGKFKKTNELPFISVRIDLAVLYLWDTIFQRYEMGEQRPFIIIKVNYIYPMMLMNKLES